MAIPFKANMFIRLALLFALVIAALIAASAAGWQQVRREVAERAQIEVERAVDSIVQQASLSNRATVDALRGETAVLRARAAAAGPPVLGVADARGAPRLSFGRRAANGDLALVDDVPGAPSDIATLYGFADGVFTPIATSARQPSGEVAAQPAIGASAEPYAALKAGHAFTGPLESGDHRFLGHFEPIIGGGGAVIGAFAAERATDAMDEVARDLANSSVFEHGYLAVVDQRGDVVFRTANLGVDWLRARVVGAGQSGADRVKGYLTIPTNTGKRDLRAFAGVSETDLDVQTIRLVGAALSLVGIVVVLALALAWLLARRLTDALHDAHTSQVAAEHAREEAVAAGAALNSELEQAAKYVESLLPPRTRDGHVSADWLYKPSVGVGGDAFGYHWLDKSHFAFYLLDVCGHGVGAALLATTVMNVIRTGTAYGAEFCAPDSVLETLNNSFPMEAQNGMYFTIWYGVYDTSTRRLSFAAAGHHPALLLTPGESPQLLQGKGLPIGCFPDVKYPVFTVAVEADARLYIFSDGIFEVELHGRQTMLTFDQFVDIICFWREQHRDRKLDFLLETIQGLQGKSKFDDDCALMELRFGGTRDLDQAA